MEQIETAVQTVGDVAVITVEGDLTAFSHEPLEQSYRASSSNHAKILISFREEDHINSAGIGVLIGLVMETRQKSQKMRFAHPSPHFRKIFDIVGLCRYVEIFASVEEALVGFE